jgi:small subunit ribosomal protein S19
MARSQKKLPYVDPRLIEKIRKTIDKAKGVAASKGNNVALSVPPIKTYARNCTIIDMMIGLEIQVHNGHKFIPVKVQENLLGHKLGEFSATRTFKGHPLLKKQKEEGKKEKK